MPQGPRSRVGDEAEVNFRVGLMGASFSTGNRGVSALASSLVGLIWQARPHASISLLIGSRDPGRIERQVGGSVRSVATVNYRLSPRASLGQQLWWIVALSWLYRVVPSRAARRWFAEKNPWIRSVAEADFVGDIRGGDSFSDIYGTREFLLGCLPVLSVIWIRRRIHLLPQTFGPFQSRLAARLARHILMRAESIWCRDRISLQEVSRLTNGRREGSLCPDVAFSMEAIRPESPGIEPPLGGEPGTTVIGLNVNGLVYHGGYTRSNMFGLKLDYPGFLKRLVEQLLSDQSNRVLLVPHTFAPEGRVESDPAACRDLMQKVLPSVRHRVHLVTQEHDERHIKGVIGMCDFFVGSRMHACIAALSQGIPTVGIAYSRKFSGVFEMVGAADWVIDGRTESVDDALGRVVTLFHARNAARSELLVRSAAASRELSRIFGHVLGLCPSSAISGRSCAVP